jgi:hypothetical protein
VIEARPGWRETSAIWCLCLLDSGERKSVGFRRVTEPVLEWEKDNAEKLAPEVAADAEEREIIESEIREARKKAAKGDAEARQHALQLAQGLAARRKIEPPTLVTTDATSEAIVGMMVSNGERALVASPEADALDVMMGRYDDKARPNLGIWLKGYSGDRVRVHRRGRGPEYLDRPALSAALAVQPEAVRGLYGSRVAHGRGLLARFFVSVPRPMVGRRTIGAPPVEERLEMAFVMSVRRLLEIELDAAKVPRVIRLDREAAALFREFEVRVEKELARGGALGEQREWGAKLCGGILRIGLVLHCLETFGRPTARAADSSLEMNAATMTAALAWAPYLIEHERLASGIAGCDPAVTVADRILRWLERTQRDTFSRRDCFSSCRGAFVREADDVDQPLRLLTELGYVRKAEPAGDETKVGRPPSPLFQVNPLWTRGEQS